ncbi:Hypothetical protein SCF082_LOCUS24885 [Durusdinium trenchii]|uniref:Uncharacterized protein n=1 Tax=Durusdinium trenchii TaxID=1381693 RepID=A0ABP0LWH2_9DINO
MLMAPPNILNIMEKFQQPLLKAVIPGRAGRIPTRRMLHLAKKKVLTFLQKEEKKEKKEREKMMKRVGNGKESMKSSTSFSSYPLSSELASDVVRAFQIASGERVLRFDWDFAKERERVKKAKFDRKREIDQWDECLAMTCGETNSLSEIFICGQKKMTQRALNSILCHESLHNLARRARRGNPFLAEDTEHMAMALLGDPQLVHEPSLAQT